MLKHVLILTIFLYVKLTCGQLSGNSLPGCSKNEFQCKIGNCIPNQDKCDGFADCVDGSDEDILSCINSRCPPRISFQCAYGGCIELEKVCDGSENCFDGSDEDVTFCNYTEPIRRCPRYQFQCKKGGCIDRKQECDGNKDCLDGSDEDPVACISRLNRVGCDLPNRLTNAKCNVVNCTTGHYIGSCNELTSTTNICIKLMCDDGFVLEEYEHDFRSACKNGSWNPELSNCEECGREEGITPLISGTYTVDRAIPWHASLYREVGNVTSGPYCGGSLVHSRAVVTAAHCVQKFNEFDLPTNLFPLNELRVAIGKLYHNYNSNDTYAQKFKVLDVRIKDYNSNLGNDIAILILDGKAHPSSVVMPICLEKYVYYTDYKYMPSSSIVGMVVGFGRTETGRVSEKLRKATFKICCGQFICKTRVGMLARQHITPDKFCVEKDSTAVEKGDSGGGFAVKRNNGRYYLYGLVSAKTETVDNVRLFTLVAYHAYWLYNELDVDKNKVII